MDGFLVTIPEAVCLSTTVALSGICYYLYRKSQKSVCRLDDAPHVTIDKKLQHLLKEIPGACLQYAVIEGAVQPIGEPLRSHFQKEMVGVMHKVMLKQQRLTWNSFLRTWNDNELVLHERVDAVPFVLLGSDKTAVKVLCPLQAAGAHMEITHEKYQPFNPRLYDILGQCLSGEKVKGQLETEEMLKVGATLTGVGELILETDGTLNLRPPSDGGQYLLSNLDFHTLRQDQVNIAFWWKVLTVTSGLLGAAVLLWIGRRYYKFLQEKWQQERERRDFERWQAEARRARAGLAEPDAIRDDEEEPVPNPCVICLTQPRTCVLLDCGHICCCFTCYQALPRPQCPICRRLISRVVPLYNI